jgi:predicted acyltransferase
LIILFGLLLAAFPYFPMSRITGVRIPGVLQRIGVCYVAGALIAWHRSSRAIVLTTAGLLLGYWAILALIPHPGLALATIDQPDRTIAAYLDRTLLGSHLWAVSKTWDPEGPLSTVSAVATVLLGVLAGRMVFKTPSVEGRLNGLFAWGIAGLMAGSVWGWIFPINKNLWTGSYVLFTAGAAATLLALVTWLIEVRRATGWARPFETFGHNPIVAFLGSGLMARGIGSLIMVTVGDTRVPLQRVIYQAGFASWASPRNASLAYAIAFVTLWYLILSLFERRGVLIKL